MNDRVKSWSDFIEEVIRNFPEVQREIQLEKIKELEYRLEQAEEWKGYWFSRCEELKKALEDLRNESVSVLRETDKVGENQGR